MNKPVLGIQLEFGFHEIKKYIHSGFADKLAKQFDIVWFVLDKKNAVWMPIFGKSAFRLCITIQVK